MEISEKIARVEEQIADCIKKGDNELVPSLQRSLDKFKAIQDGEKKKPSEKTRQKAASKNEAESDTLSKLPSKGRELSKGGAEPKQGDSATSIDSNFPVIVEDGIADEEKRFRQSEKYHFLEIDYHPLFSRMNLQLRDELKAWVFIDKYREDDRARRREAIERKTAEICAYIESYAKSEYKHLLYARGRKLKEHRYNFNIEQTLKNYKLE